MRVWYNRKLDRWIDLRRGSAGYCMHDYVMDEIELGGRTAQALDDEDQAWWVLYANEPREMFSDEPVIK